MIDTDDVFKAGCLECDWNYYTLTEQRAHVWAIAHSDEEGHGVSVKLLERGGE